MDPVKFREFDTYPALNSFMGHVALQFGDVRAVTLPGPRPGASWSKLRFSLPPPLTNTSPEKLRLDGAEFAPLLVALDVPTNGLRSHSFADGSDEVARTPHFA